jgi:hypothetical protein
MGRDNSLHFADPTATSRTLPVFSQSKDVQQ